jgi:hypothetical protein
LDRSGRLPYCSAILELHSGTWKTRLEQIHGKGHESLVLIREHMCWPNFLNALLHAIAFGNPIVQKAPIRTAYSLGVRVFLNLKHRQDDIRPPAGRSPEQQGEGAQGEGEVSEGEGSEGSEGSEV